MYQFINTTTFHGFKETRDAASKIEQALWIITLSLAFGMLSFTLFTVIQNHLSEPTTSLISSKLPQFPEVLVCTPEWVDERKAKAIGLDNQSLMMVFSYLVDANYNWTSYKLNTTSTKEKVAEIMKINNMNNLQELIFAISYAPDEIIPYARLTHGDGRVSKRLSLNLHSLCVMLRPLNPPNPNDLTWGGLDIEVSQLVPPYGIVFQDKDIVYVYVGNEGTSILPFESTKVYKGHEIVLKVIAGFHKRAQLTRAPCKDWDKAEKMMCVMKMFNRQCQEISNVKEVFLPGQNQSFRDISGHFESTSCLPHVNTDPVLRTADAECQIPCSQSIYRSAVIPTLPKRKTHGMTYIHIGLTNVQASWSVVESKASTACEMINKIGGSFSLWSGASIITITHLLYFCVARKIQNLIRKDSDGRNQ